MVLLYDRRVNPEMENLWNAAAHPAVEVEIENTRSAAHQAIEDGDVEELSRLLDSGVGPNEVSNEMTLLVHAIDYEADAAIQSNGDMSVTMTAVLLAYGASPKLRAPSGESPLEVALEYGHEMAVRLLNRVIKDSSGG